MPYDIINNASNLCRLYLLQASDMLITQRYGGILRSNNKTTYASIQELAAAPAVSDLTDKLRLESHLRVA